MPSFLNCCHWSTSVLQISYVILRRRQAWMVSVQSDVSHDRCLFIYQTVWKRICLGQISNELCWRFRWLGTPQLLLHCVAVNVNVSVCLESVSLGPFVPVCWRLAASHPALGPKTSRLSGHCHANKFFVKWSQCDKRSGTPKMEILQRI